MNLKNDIRFEEHYGKLLRDKGVFEKGDIAKLAELSVRHKMQQGRGYSGMMIRNYIFYGFPCTLEMYNLIICYFEEKIETKRRLDEKMKSMLQHLQNQ